MKNLVGFFLIIFIFYSVNSFHVSNFKRELLRYGKNVIISNILKFIMIIVLLQLHSHCKYIAD